MKIGLVLPGCKKNPSGGTKVIYQYANFLAESDKNHVIIYFDMSCSSLNRYNNIRIIQKIMADILVYMRPNWFRLNSKIKKRAILSINDSTIQNGDIVVATGIQTANPVAHLSEKKGKKYYFIQGFENWDYEDEFVLQSYNLGMQNMTIANWLSRIVDKESGKSSILINNGIDTNVFSVKIPLKYRPVHSIAMQYSSVTCKGCEYALETIRILETKYSDLSVTIFSSEPKPDCLPSCCKYIVGAKQEEVAEIDNNSKIFICSSIEEGFGLPGLEAMACGCVLVATDYRGVFEYAEHKVNALLSPVCDAKAMAFNVIELFENDELWYTLAINAEKTASKRSITISAQQFADALLHH